MPTITPQLRPTVKQFEAYNLLWDDVTRFLLFGGGAEGGKSWLGAEWLLTNCYRYPGSKWFIGRNELTRLMASSYATFRKVCAHHKIPETDWRFNGQYHYIEFVDGLAKGSRIDLLDLKFQPSDPMFQRYGSTEYTGGWIEEAGEVHFMAFDLLKTRVGRWMNEQFGLLTPKILLTCNPEQNWLYRIFYKPWKKNMLPPGYAFVQALYKDNPYTLAQSEDRLNQITDPILRARLKMGLWEYNAGDNSLISYDAIIDLFTNTPIYSEEKFLTADVARYGSDKITKGLWRGFDLYSITAKTKQGIDQTSLDIRESLNTERIPFSHGIADEDGVGGGVVDSVRGIKGFVGNSSALPIKDNQQKSGTRRDNYGNLRSQCAFMLAEIVNNHGMAITAQIDEPTKEMIIDELRQIKRLDSPTEAPLRIIPKDEIKEVLGRSPDYADMMMMRMYFELDKPTTYRQNNNVGGVAPLIPGVIS